MHPEEDRESTGCAIGRLDGNGCKDAQLEAVLGSDSARRVAVLDLHASCGGRARGCELDRREPRANHAEPARSTWLILRRQHCRAPGLRRPWRPPPKIAHGRLSVGHSAPCADVPTRAGFDGATDRAEAGQVHDQLRRNTAGSPACAEPPQEKECGSTPHSSARIFFRRLSSSGPVHPASPSPPLHNAHLQVAGSPSC